MGYSFNKDGTVHISGLGANVPYKSVEPFLSATQKNDYSRRYSNVSSGSKVNSSPNALLGNKITSIDLSSLQELFGNFSKAQTKLVEEANRLSIAEAQKARDFSASQALLDRQFNAEQAQLSRDFSLDLFNREQTFNSAEAQKNRDWQTEMSNTSYQRAVKDMISAGLNPILAYQQGGASTPAGSTAHVSGGSSASASHSSVGTSSARIDTPKISDILSTGINALVSMNSNSSKNVTSIINSLLGLAGNLL